MNSHPGMPLIFEVAREMEKSIENNCLSKKTELKSVVATGYPQPLKGTL